MLGTHHYISIGYLIISLVLVMMRKYRLRFIALIPALCQIASVLLLKGMGFPTIFTALLFIVNLAILAAVHLFENKQMADEFPAGEPYAENNYASDVVSAETGYEEDSDLTDEQDFNVPPGRLPDIPEVAESDLKFPEVENRPINEVAPVQHEIFDASNTEVKEMIDSMLDSGDMANAKRYLRMLAFFAKDESTRELAEKRLAEVSKMG